MGLITKEFELYDPNYLARRSMHEKRLDALKLKLIRSEQRGKALPCSRRHMVEAEWLLDYTAEWERLDRELAALEKSLANKDQDFALQQAPDGSWGACYDVWFEKINGTLDAIGHLRRSSTGSPPVLQYPLSIFATIDSPQTLIAYLYGLQLSQIAKTGIYEREELGAIEAAMSQFLFKKKLRALLKANGATFVDQVYVDSYRRFLDDTQDPISGYWGPWITTNGEVIRASDLSLTFHAISYRDGKVNYWPKIIETTFAIRDLPYPFGWMHRGHFNNHNNYDVAKIFHLGWAHMTSTENSRARTEIRAMLKWTLDESITSDGQFKDDPSFYDSVGEAYYYGVSFLDEIGYWDSGRRFWDDGTSEFPASSDLCSKMGGQLAKLQRGSRAAQDALRKLSETCPHAIAK